MTTNVGQRRRTGARGRSLALALALAGVSGCGLFSGANKPAPNQYWLKPITDFQGEIQAVDWQLMVKPITATMGLDTVKIAKRTSQYHIEYFEGAVGSDAAPRMVQMLAIEGFENSGRITAVAHEDSGVVADYILQLDLLDFTANATSENTGFVNLDVTARLIWLQDAEVVASRRFTIQEYYGGTEEDHRRGRVTKSQQSIRFHFIVQAFSKVNEAFSAELVEWTLAAGQEHAVRAAQAKAAADAAPPAPAT